MSPFTTPTQKICASCGRMISWRKKWERNWDAIMYCSQSCRKHKIKPDSIDVLFESKILSLLNDRRMTLGSSAVLTCEEAEKEVTRESEGAHGRLQEAPIPGKTREGCRQAARRLAARGEIVVTQGGKVVDPSFAKGVMELKLPS